MICPRSNPIWKEFQRFSLTLSVSTNNSKCLDFFRIGFPILARKGGETDTQFQVSKQNSILDIIDTYRILWKAVFDESRMYGLEGDLSYLSRSTLQYGAKKPKSQNK
ncbi:hypothetical protein VNO77_47299 [Canavalia gladiata]|uniref:Uncharacterized protein n=1 Tax=Canavalia gladiata TaxID=3824 RepID=A0AAN9JFR8_CANGL